MTGPRARRRRAASTLVVLSDVLEHVADPIAVRSQHRRAPAVRGALWIVSVPNYAVWYNRIRPSSACSATRGRASGTGPTCASITRRTVRELLEYCGFELSTRRARRRSCSRGAPACASSSSGTSNAGDHLALADSRAYSSTARRRAGRVAALRGCGRSSSPSRSCWRRASGNGPMTSRPPDHTSERTHRGSPRPFSLPSEGARATTRGKRGAPANWLQRHASPRRRSPGHSNGSKCAMRSYVSAHDPGGIAKAITGEQPAQGQ